MSDGAWYVKDFADGWIKFNEVAMAIHEAKKTGAVMKFSLSDPNNTRPDNSTDGALERVIQKAKAHAGSFCDFKEYEQNEADCLALRQAALQKPEPIEGLDEALEIYASNKVGATVICNKLWQAAKRYQEMSGA